MGVLGCWGRGCSETGFFLLEMVGFLGRFGVFWGKNWGFFGKSFWVVFFGKIGFGGGGGKWGFLGVGFVISRESFWVKYGGFFGINGGGGLVKSGVCFCKKKGGGFWHIARGGLVRTSLRLRVCCFQHSRVSFSPLHRRNGYDVKPLPYSEWRQQLMTAISSQSESDPNALTAILPTFTENWLDTRIRPKWERTNTDAGLATVPGGFPFPDIDSTMDIYLQYLVDVGFLQPNQKLKPTGKAHLLITRVAPRPDQR